MGKRAVPLFLVIVFFFPPLLFSAPPQVIGTNPPNGAVGVRPDFNFISIKYDQPVDAWILPGENCFEISPEWADNPQPGEYFWGERILIPRDLIAFEPGDPDWSPLPYGTEIEVTINPPGASPEHCFCDSQGNPLPTHHLRFTIQEHPDDPPIEPQVIATEPPNGATGVDPTIQSFSLTFNKPMNTSQWKYSMYFFFGSVATHWSPDGRTLTFTRDNDNHLLHGSEVVTILNNDGYERFQDLQGNVLKEYTYSFQVAGDLDAYYEQLLDMEFVKISANPGKGFHWPYYLGVPERLQGLTTLFVVPNNSQPCEDHILHDVYARRAALYPFGEMIASQISTPILVPTFPRYPYAYLHNLSGICFEEELLSQSLERIDLQLLAMIQDARTRLAGYGLLAEEKIFMTGFSASAQFTSFFSIIHPERIKAAAAGGGNPSLPVATWQGEDVVWGTARVEEWTGAPFDLNAFKQVPLFFYIGNQDFNFTHPDQFTFAECEDVYDAVGADAQFKVYQGAGHEITTQGWEDLRAFFASYPPDPSKIRTSLNGSVTYNSMPVCAMVLVNGKYCFSNPSDGTYALTGIPLDSEGNLTVQVFCSGLAPLRTKLTATGLSMAFDPQLTKEDRPPLSIDSLSCRYINDTEARVSGFVSYQGTPVTAMVLANGQYMFTGNQEGSFEMVVPQDVNGKITLMVFCSNLAPYRQTLTPE